jgi:hypothetical protein
MNGSLHGRTVGERQVQRIIFAQTRTNTHTHVLSRSLRSLAFSHSEQRRCQETRNNNHLPTAPAPNQGRG